MAMEATMATKVDETSSMFGCALPPLPPWLSLMVCVAAGGCSLSLDRAHAGRLVRSGRLLPPEVATHAMKGTNLTSDTGGCVLALCSKREPR